MGCCACNTWVRTVVSLLICTFLHSLLSHHGHPRLEISKVDMLLLFLKHTLMTSFALKIEAGIPPLTHRPSTSFPTLPATPLPRTNCNPNPGASHVLSLLWDIVQADLFFWNILLEFIALPLVSTYPSMLRAYHLFQKTLP